MAGQTVVKYGAVVITQCHTNRWEQEPVRDSSGADTMMQRFTISVTGFVHAKSSGDESVGVNPRSSTISQTYEGVSQILGAPRLKFQYLVGCNVTATGGQTVFDVDAATNTGKIDKNHDVDNGPRCLSFSVTNVVADQLWRVVATFQFAITNCARGGSNESSVLSNRWSVRDTIDGDRYTGRVYRGRLRMSSGQINPNSFRNLVVPTLNPGMRRESMDFLASEDGLELAYTITDREAAYAAPEPATSWEIVHTERSSLNSTPTGVGDISISLIGDRNVNRPALIALGLKIMNDRLRGGQALQNNASDYITDLSVTDYWGSSGPLRIVVQATVVHTAKADAKNNINGLIFASQKIGTDLLLGVIAGYDRHLSRDGRIGETPATAGPVPLTGAFVVYLQSACSNQHDIGQNQDTTLVTRNRRQNDGPAITAATVRGLPDQPPDYVDRSHFDAVYMEYRMESKYSTGMHKVALPIADDPGARYRNSADQPDSLKVVRLAPPTTMRRLRIRASRIGLEPEFPQPVETYQDGNTVAHLMDIVVLPAVPTRTGDGKQVFTADAEYLYALTRPAKAEDTMRVGVAPWDRSGLQKTSKRLLTTYSEDSRSNSLTRA